MGTFEAYFDLCGERERRGEEEEGQNSSCPPLIKYFSLISYTDVSQFFKTYMQRGYM